jgi:fatty acid desaturase 2 (delta-6 desaturase)
MGKGGDRTEKDSKDKTSTSATPKEVLLNGIYYDISTLKHPGGSVIDFYATKGIDATQAFENFHFRSAKAKKYLSSLPQRPAVEKKVAPLPGQEALLKDFEELTTQFVAEGKFRPSLIHCFYRISEIVLMHFIGIFLILKSASTAPVVDSCSFSYLVAGIAILALGQGRCGWLMHEGGHHSLTGIIKVDVLLQQLIYGLGCGMSGGWWRIQHNKHHSMPQKLGHDVDLNTLPLVAFTNKVVSKRHGSIQRGWLFLQAYLFPLLTTLLVALGWQFYLHPRHIIRSKNIVEALSLIIRYVAWTLLFTSKFGFAKSALIYLVYNWFAANYIFINFALSHTHLDTVEKEDTQVSLLFLSFFSLSNPYVLG